jgi:hypothetical protein
VPAPVTEARVVVLGVDPDAVRALVEPLAERIVADGVLRLGSSVLAVERYDAIVVVAASPLPTERDAFLQRALDLATRLGAPGAETAKLA